MFLSEIPCQSLTSPLISQIFQPALMFSTVQRSIESAWPVRPPGTCFLPSIISLQVAPPVLTNGCSCHGRNPIPNQHPPPQPPCGFHRRRRVWPGTTAQIHLPRICHRHVRSSGRNAGSVGGLGETLKNEFTCVRACVLTSSAESCGYLVTFSQPGYKTEIIKYPVGIYFTKDGLQ